MKKRKKKITMYRALLNEQVAIREDFNVMKSQIKIIKEVVDYLMASKRYIPKLEGEAGANLLLYVEQEIEAIRERNRS